MQPLGRKPIKFPGKKDHHVRPKRLWKNWWEVDFTSVNKKAARQKANKICHMAVQEGLDKIKPMTSLYQTPGTGDAFNVIANKIQELSDKVNILIELQNSKYNTRQT